MKIASSDISLASERSYTEEDTRSESLTVRVGNRSTTTLRDSTEVAAQLAADTVRISLRAESLRQSMAEGGNNTVSGTDSVDGARDDEHSASLIQLIIEALTGKKIRVMSLGAGRSRTVPETQGGPHSQNNGASNRVGWGVSYDYRATHTERETTSFNADGVIKTSDGREISFSLNLTMDREFTSSESLSLRAGDPVQVDPLVINFDGSAADLTDTRFAFDLDSDGDKEDIAFVTSGSGFLVLDKNGDGVVNDGSELFGPQSGNGFSELAAYDSDGNGWIDENDAVYRQLQVWAKDSEGNDSLSNLQSMEIGAIYLASAKTDFTLTDNAGESNGQVSRTGIYVEEGGAVKTIQQVDLNA